jgi:DOPA 4,5-dioxygenase
MSRLGPKEIGNSPKSKDLYKGSNPYESLHRYILAQESQEHSFFQLSSAKASPRYCNLNLHKMNSEVSLLEEYKQCPPLPTTTHRSGKGLALDPLPPSYTTTHSPSSAYNSFPSPITLDFVTGGFDAHICFELSSAEQVAYGKQLQARIRYEFPELRIYELFEEPAGPFVTGSFEISLRTPLELGTLTAWLTIHRGPLSVLVHSNTDMGEEDGSIGDHTIRAFWLGEKKELNLGFFGNQKRS